MQILKHQIDEAGGEVGKFVWQYEWDPTLPSGWTYNALRSELLRETFPGDQINHYTTDEPPMIFWLPANFGKKRVRP